MDRVVEVWVSKGAAELAKERGHVVKKGENTLDVDVAMDIEADMFSYHAEHGGTPQGRAAASLSRSLATAIEQTRTIEQVHGEIRTTLDGRWDDEDAVETQVQLMVHRGWDRSWAVKAIRTAHGV